LVAERNNCQVRQSKVVIFLYFSSRAKLFFVAMYVVAAIVEIEEREEKSGKMNQ
jgi:hypothetical protein